MQLLCHYQTRVTLEKMTIQSLCCHHLQEARYLHECQRSCKNMGTPKPSTMLAPNKCILISPNSPPVTQMALTEKDAHRHVHVLAPIVQLLAHISSQVSNRDGDVQLNLHGGCGTNYVFSRKSPIAPLSSVPEQRQRVLPGQIQLERISFTPQHTRFTRRQCKSQNNDTKNACLHLLHHWRNS